MKMPKSAKLAKSSSDVKTASRNLLQASKTSTGSTHALNAKAANTVTNALKAERIQILRRRA